MTIVLSAAYLLSRPCNSYPGILLSIFARAAPFPRLHPATKDPRDPHRVSRAYIFKEGLTIKRVQDRRSNEIGRAVVS